MKRISISEFIELIEDAEAVIEDYAFSRNQDEEELRPKLREIFKENSVLENNLKDFVSLVESQFYLHGLYDGIRLTNIINGLK
mgnify:FL=1